MANGSKSGKAGKPSKEAKAAAKAARRQASKERRTQLWQAFQMQRKEDKLLLPLMLGTLVGLAVVFFLVGLIWGLQWFLLPIGLLLGVLGAFIIFGRRVQKTVYGKAEGQADEGQVPLSQLQKHLNKLPKNIDTKRMDAIESRLAALSSRGGGAALPKGPMPGGAKMRGVQRTIRRR
ncbi:MAG: DUF4191 family protein [Rhodococcus sp. (in: high G+C Gram-positive bacteria)]|nr:MAG: DUF4191 family protein [Rhodococcus sp. (in: high G+C Gram-positive bacteria)]